MNSLLTLSMPELCLEFICIFSLNCLSKEPSDTDIIIILFQRWGNRYLEYESILNRI